MQKTLNIDKANQAIESKGLTQTAIAKALDVSKEAVSQWLKGKSFPRPNKLLQLGKLLELGFEELVIKQDPLAPKVAFRKMKGTKTQNHHIEKAQEMGYFLRHLVPFLPFDTLEMPPVLKSPSCEYDYLCEVTAKVRGDINLSEMEVVDFSHLIRRFSELQTVIIPVLWGSKERHENALHIHLPDSQTTWVYLNLDTNIHDFKFWMAHELGHCLSPILSGNEAEDFADAFAGALLFPYDLAVTAYQQLAEQRTVAAKINLLKSMATDYVISPYTVKGQVDKYAEHNGLPLLNFGKSLGGAITNFNKTYHNVSEVLFGEDREPAAKEYIEKIEQEFSTSFFDLLRQYLKKNSKGAGMVQAVMDMPLLDARSIHAELT